MRLERVRYEGFASDAEWLGDHPESPFHEVDREVRLVFEDAEDLFVATVQRGLEFVVNYGTEPHFEPPIPVVLDYTLSPIWQDLVGRDIRLSYYGSNLQVLAASSSSASVYLCSYEQGVWSADTLYVANELPT